MTVGLEEGEERGQVVQVELQRVLDQGFQGDSLRVHPTDQHVQEVLSGLDILVALLSREALEEVDGLREEDALVEEGVEQVQRRIVEETEEKLEVVDTEDAYVGKQHLQQRLVLGLVHCLY